MDLKNFVSEALYQIIAGIKAAQERIKEFNDGIEPKLTPPSLTPPSDAEQETELHDVQFDIALTILKEELAQPSGLSVMGLSMIGKGSLEQIGSLVSRVRFSVPISYPYAPKLPYIPSHFKSWGLNNTH